MTCDVGDLRTIDGFVKAFCAKAWALDGVLNAETACMLPFEMSVDGIEKQFAVNYLGHFKLTALLMNELIRTAAANGREGRVVNVTSSLHHFTYRVRQGTTKPSRGIDFGNLNETMGYTALNSYGQSKLAQILHAWTLSERLAKNDLPVRCVAASPGMTELEVDRSLDFPGGAFFSGLVKSTMISSVEDAASTPYHCLTSPSLPQGTYFSDGVPAKSSLPSRDPRLAARLWEFSEEQCGIIPAPASA
jgi:WW domain-containing oxidoreductase